MNQAWTTRVIDNVPPCSPRQTEYYAIVSIYENYEGSWPWIFILVCVLVLWNITHRSYMCSYNIYIPHTLWPGTPYAQKCFLMPQYGLNAIQIFIRIWSVIEIATFKRYQKVNFHINPKWKLKFADPGHPTTLHVYCFLSDRREPIISNEQV